MYGGRAARRVSPRTSVENALARLPGLDARPSRWGGQTAYHVGDREIAHFHGATRLDVRLTKEGIRELMSEGPVDPRITTRGASAHWVAVRLGSARDVAFVLALVERAVRANA